MKVKGLTVKESGVFILKDISFTINEGEVWAVTGTSGGGKTSLLKRLMHFKLFPENIFFSPENPKIALVNHQYGFKDLTGSSNFYYQQRFNSTESECTVTVIESMASDGLSEGQAIFFLNELQILSVQNRPLIQLSNGEQKRLQIAKALSKKPDWLLIDEPYTGLDVASRKALAGIFASLVENGLRVLMVSTSEIPEFITHVAMLENGILTGVHKRNMFLKSREKKYAAFYANKFVYSSAPAKMSSDYAVQMKDVCVAYNGKEVLHNICWEVRSGESWSLSGPNGSGKSTLLSLITGDHPQAFAHDIRLYDRPRGTGETIWDIKKRIGFLSPELHHYFDKSFTVFQTVASGLFDTIGLFKKLNSEQNEIVKACLQQFSLEKEAGKTLSTLPNGLQRWALLARAFVKNPPMFILDEPCQGLDPSMVQQFLSFVESVCNTPERTLLYVSHVYDEIPACVDHSLKLQQGKIIEIKKNGKANHSHSGRRNRA